MSGLLYANNLVSSSEPEEDLKVTLWYVLLMCLQEKRSEIHADRSKVIV